MIASTGSVIIYRSAAALVTAFSGGKFAVRTCSGDTKNIREKDIVFVLHKGPVQRIPEPAAPTMSEEDIASLMEGAALPFSDFTELAFGSGSPEAAYGAWKMLEEGFWFRLTDDRQVISRPREEIEAALQASREKAEAKEKHDALVERLKSGSLLPEDKPFLSEIEQVALGVNSASRLMREMGIEALPEKAHKLLIRLGVWDLTRDPFPERAGHPVADPDLPLPPDKDMDADRRDLDMEAWAIDDEDSHDPDDAISWQNGLLYVHTADPASCIVMGDAVDQEACRRGENLYLPEKIIHMLPPETTRRFGLGLSEQSKALTFVIRFTPEGEPVLEEFFLSRLKVTRLTYETANEILARPELQELQDCLEKFRRLRAGAGAMFIRLPEVKISYNGSEISFKPCPVTPEREFVANAMLAAGYAMAKYAAGHDIAMPFVRQEPPDPPVEPGESLPAMYTMRRSCKPGTTDTLPGLHAGLGLEPYLRVTSPLRRYSDLLAHYQIHRLIAGEEPLTSDEIAEALHTSEASALTARRLERLVNEYWTLLYFAKHPDLQTEAVLVYRQDDRAFFLLPEFAYEYRTRFRGGQTGDIYTASVLASDPPAFTLRLKLSRGQEQFEASGEKEPEGPGAE